MQTTIIQPIFLTQDRNNYCPTLAKSPIVLLYLGWTVIWSTTSFSQFLVLLCVQTYCKQLTIHKCLIYVPMQYHSMTYMAVKWNSPNMTTFEHVFIGESTEEQKKYHKKVV